MIIIKHGIMYKFVCKYCGCEFCASEDECDADTNNVSCNCPDCNNRLENGTRILSSGIMNLLNCAVSDTIKRVH